MKNLLKGIVIFSSLLFVTGCNEKVEELKKEVLQVGGTTEQIVRNYYVVKEDTNIYTDYSSIQYEGKELSEVLSNKEIDIYDLINKTELVSEANDGGSKLYKDGNVYISVCNSLEENGNNHNIYIMGNKSYITSICSFNITSLEECLKSNLNSYLTSKKVTSKNGKITDISKIKNYEKITYKKSKLGEYIIVKTSDESLINAIKKYFKKKNKNYYYSNFAIYLNETYHIFFYNSKNSNVEEKIEKCLNLSWNDSTE